VEYAGRGRTKLAPGKVSLPGRKQVFRLEQDGVATHDIVARVDEALRGRPLLEPVMSKGRRLTEGRVSLGESRARAKRELAALPPRIRALEPASPPYRVEVSAALTEDAAAARRRYEA
jgi:nicotinate phosphoribosyltransferase